MVAQKFPDRQHGFGAKLSTGLIFLLAALRAPVDEVDRRSTDSKHA